MTNKKIIIEDIIVYLILLLGVLTTLAICGSKLNHRLKKLPFAIVRLEYTEVPQTDINTATQDLLELYNTFHFYKEIKFKTDRQGVSAPLLHLILIDKDLKETEPDTYILTYAHELTHIRYCASDEVWINFQMIKILYESNNPYFKALAWNNSVEILSGAYGDNDYGCGAYLIDYFNLKGENYEM